MQAPYLRSKSTSLFSDAQKVSLSVPSKIKHKAKFLRRSNHQDTLTSAGDVTETPPPEALNSCAILYKDTLSQSTEPFKFSFKEEPVSIENESTAAAVDAEVKLSEMSLEAGSKQMPKQTSSGVCPGTATQHTAVNQFKMFTSDNSFKFNF